MIRVVIFDLGLTLLDARERPFPHVIEALQAIADFRTADGHALRSCLVSDYEMPATPTSTLQIGRLFRAYLTRLQASGLQPLFEPVQRRVTLSTHAGVFKPERALFETALRRLRAAVALKECLLVTEDAAHVHKVRRQLGMQALRFRGGAGADFEDWAHAPALIAHRVAPEHAGNLHAAVRAQLAAQGVELETLERDAAGHYLARGQVWRPVAVPGLPEPVGSLHMALPVSATLRRDAQGRLKVRLKKPGAAEEAEARHFAASLAHQGQIADAGQVSRGATHEIATDAQGRSCLRRRRFSAL